MSQQTVHLDDLESLVGTPIGPTEWHDMDQRMVDGFADVTGDHQWIHTDPERAARESPFGGPIAHGHLTLSLVPFFLPQLATVTGFSMGVNYGANKVRFPMPVTVGSRIRAGAVVTEAEEITGGVQVVVTITAEIDGQAKPACVVESMSRFLR